MSVLVEQQDETINVIETTAATVEKDVEVGYVGFQRSYYDEILIMLFVQSELHREGCGFCKSSTQEALDLLYPYTHHSCHYRYHRRCRCVKQHQEELDFWSIWTGGPASCTVAVRMARRRGRGCSMHIIYIFYLTLHFEWTTLLFPLLACYSLARFARYARLTRLGLLPIARPPPLCF